ncbi:hypothetical protein BDR05DRAFT_1003142 [Suillus weaverae]|nr:hypothetical protein BDR05DRAFT_1003142 [Suillus weaverae]
MKAVCPFYNQEPGAPPPLPPMLTDQLELFGAHSSTMLMLTADKILHPKASHVQLNQLMDTPEFKLGTWLSKNTDYFSSPYSKRVSFEHSHSQTPMPSDSSDSIDSVSDSGSSTSATSLSEDSKIPKPPDEPGHLGRGGCTLHETLNWSPKAYVKFKKFMHHLVEEHLDTTKCASSQSPVLLKCVHNKAVDAFPNMYNYSGFCPVNDMVMMRLKYTSGHARQKEARMASGKNKSKKHTSHST